MKMIQGVEKHAAENKSAETTGTAQNKADNQDKSKKAEPEIPKTVLLENYMKSMYDFRYNVVNCKFEYTHLGSIKWAPVDRILLNSIRRDLNNSGSSLRCSRDRLESIVESSFSPPRNPIKDYFLSLSSVTGTENISRLLDTVRVSNEERWRVYMTKWLVAVVANAMDDTKCCNHTCLVLSGGQGIGKTTWLNGLCPDSLKGEYLYVGKLNPDNKDALRLVAERLFINIDDQLQVINRIDEDKIKSIITQPKVSYRKPYDINVQDYPHRASFMASVNSADYLTDSTGSRRFLSFEVDSISLEGQKSVNMHLVYAECMNLLKSGFHYWFEGNEISELEAQNRNFMLNTHEYDLLIQVFRIASHDEEITCQPLTATQIHHRLEVLTSDRLNFVKVCKALRRMVREWGLKNKSFRVGGSVYHGYLLCVNEAFDITNV